MSALNPPSLILASTSSARRELLSNAGLQFECEASGVDETAAKAGLRGATIAGVAIELAALKSLAVSRRKPDALVIGADQTLEVAGVGLDKPASIDEARKQLMQLRGTTHQLHSALCCSRDGAILWQHSSSASLTMRAFSEAELQAYLTEMGPKLLHSVGAYQVEGPAIQLFSRIEGDYFTILGLPLLPLLDFLRRRGIGLA